MRLLLETDQNIAEISIKFSQDGTILATAEPKPIQQEYVQPISRMQPIGAELVDNQVVAEVKPKAQKQNKEKPVVHVPEIQNREPKVVETMSGNI